MNDETPTPATPVVVVQTDADVPVGSVAVIGEKRVAVAFGLLALGEDTRPDAPVWYLSRSIFGTRQLSVPCPNHSNERRGHGGPCGNYIKRISAVPPPEPFLCDACRSRLSF